MSTQIDLEEPSVASSLRLLEQCGFTLDILLQLSDIDIERLAPSFITGLDAVLLKVALIRKRKDEERKKEEDAKKKEAADIVKKNHMIYKSFFRYVGRVEADFQDGSTQFGSCVLVWKLGYALTALHILEREEKGEGKELVGTRSKRKLSASLSRISVILPNASPQPIRYAAVVVQSSSDDDLALLRASDPLPDDFAERENLSTWPPYTPSIGDYVMVLSFPTGKGEERRIAHNPSTYDDLPWMSEGTVSRVDGAKGQAFAFYNTFGGSSGALVVHPTDWSIYRLAIHLGTFHESVELLTWGMAEFGKLNENLGDKSFNGYFSLRAPALLDAHFRAGTSTGVVSPIYLHPQVVVRRKKEKKKGPGGTRRRT